MSWHKSPKQYLGSCCDNRLHPSLQAMIGFWLCGTLWNASSQNTTARSLAQRLQKRTPKQLFNGLAFLSFWIFPPIGGNRMIVRANMFIIFLAPVYLEDAFNKFVQLWKQYEDIVCRCLSNCCRSPGCQTCRAEVSNYVKLF